MPARGVAPAPVGLPPPSPATAGLPQSTFWGSLFQGMMQAPAYEQQQLQLDMQRLQNYEQYYNAIVPQVLANRPLAGDQRMISILSTAAKQAGVPAPITIVNGKPQIDVDALGRQALNNFIEKNSDLWYGKWSSTQRVSFAQRMGWIPPGYDWQKDDAFTAQQSETLPEKQRMEIDYVKAFDDAVKSNDPAAISFLRSEYDHNFGPGAFERAVPGYKAMLKQVAENFAMEAQKKGLDLQKEVAEIEDDLQRGQYLKAETVLENMKSVTESYRPPEVMAHIHEMQAQTEKALIEAQNAVSAGAKLPESFMQVSKNLDAQINSITAGSQTLIAEAYSTTATRMGQQNKDNLLKTIHSNLQVIKALEPQYFQTHLLLDINSAQTNPSLNPPIGVQIGGQDVKRLAALRAAQALLQVRTTGGIAQARDAYEKLYLKYPDVVNWLNTNYQDLMNYIYGGTTSFEAKATDPAQLPSTSAIPSPTPAPSPSPTLWKGKKVLIPAPPPVIPVDPGQSQ